MSRFDSSFGMDAFFKGVGLGMQGRRQRTQEELERRRMEGEDQDRRDMAQERGRIAGIQDRRIRLDERALDAELEAQAQQQLQQKAFKQLVAGQIASALSSYAPSPEDVLGDFGGGGLNPGGSPQFGPPTSPPAAGIQYGPPAQPEMGNLAALAGGGALPSFAAAPRLRNIEIMAQADPKEALKQLVELDKERAVWEGRRGQAQYIRTQYASSPMAKRLADSIEAGADDHMVKLEMAKLGAGMGDPDVIREVSASIGIPPQLADTLAQAAAAGETISVRDLLAVAKEIESAKGADVATAAGHIQTLFSEASPERAHAAAWLRANDFPVGLGDANLSGRQGVDPRLKLMESRLKLLGDQISLLNDKRKALGSFPRPEQTQPIDDKVAQLSAQHEQLAGELDRAYQQQGSSKPADSQQSSLELDSKKAAVTAFQQRRGRRPDPMNAEDRLLLKQLQDEILAGASRQR